MQMIYEPKGRAREYAPLALNLFNGCTNGCRYCYVPDMPLCRCKGIDMPKFHAKTELRAEPDVFFAELEKSCRKYQGDPREILLCFTCDPFPHDDLQRQFTWRALAMMSDFRLRVTVLTKNPKYFLEDIELFAGNDWRVGVTMTGWTDDYWKRFEPNTESPQSRALSMADIADYGISTWCSIEPVIFPIEAFAVMANCHLDGIFDEWRIGKINHHPEIENGVDWQGFVDIARDRLRGERVIFKESLQQYL